VHPDEGRYEFAAGDALVEMARSNGLSVNGHTLVWHSQCPDWFFVDNGKPAGRDVVLKRMREHIAAVAGHYAGKMASWDVVNEAIDDGREYLRKSKWLTSIGEDFIAEAFVAARQADPKAELIYNDYGIEGGAKREKTLRLIRDLKQRKAPITGVGIQGHWSVDYVPLKAIEDAIVAFHAEGMKVAITELDIDVVTKKTIGADVNAREKGTEDPFANGLTAEVQKRLTEQYTQLFALLHKHSDKVSRVTFWGLHDGRSWLNGWPRKRTNHPLFFDRSLLPKPVVESVLRLGK
jgi:endo-1,4-beta-xylanase